MNRYAATKETRDFAQRNRENSFLNRIPEEQ